MSELTKLTPQKRPSFPRRCSACGKREVRPAVVSNSAIIKHHGRPYEIQVPALHVLSCDACGDRLFGNQAHEQISRALRSKLGFLQPEEIRALRKKKGWTQKKLAEVLLVAETTVSKWETGVVIQSKRNDRALRECLQAPSVSSSAVANVAEQCVRRWGEACTQEVADAIVGSVGGDLIARRLMEGRIRWGEVVSGLVLDSAGNPDIADSNLRLRNFENRSGVYPATSHYPVHAGLVVNAITGSASIEALYQTPPRSNVANLYQSAQAFVSHVWGGPEVRLCDAAEHRAICRAWGQEPQERHRRWDAECYENYWHHLIAEAW